MAIIETKFSLGDVVWHASTAVVQREHPCPDCLGVRSWEARSPAGGVFQVPCPRCSVNYTHNRALSLKYSQHAALVSRLTIGQVRACAGPDGKHEYMAHETGIGSGSLYYEDRLFSTKEEAEQHAQAIADAGNADANSWIATQYSDTAQFSDYQLKDASIKAAEDRARSAQIKLEIFSEDIRSAEDMDEVRSSLRIHFPEQVEA